MVKHPLFVPIVVAVVALLGAFGLMAADSLSTPWPAPDREKADPMRAELRHDFPAAGFQFIEVGPWLIATNLEKDAADGLVKSAISFYAASIQRQLFTKTVRSEPVKVLLFKDAESYAEWNQKLFNEKPSTPFGYFSRSKKSMVMNIGTGAGTLTHEMVHAMAEADFPGIPAWLNEGLGSLYEAPRTDKDKRVVGGTNWRLKGLLADLRNGSALHYRDVIGVSDKDFYGTNSSKNYASMRYLMQWLQDQGKLEAFYTRIRDGKDDTGQAALRAVFDNTLSVDEIEEKVYAWVKTKG